MITRNLIIAFLLATAACESKSASDDDGTPAAASGEPIVVGSTLSLSGAFAATGAIHKIAGEAFVERINKEGGLLGRPIEWVVRDDESDQAKVSTLYEQIQDRPNIITRFLVIGRQETLPSGDDKTTITFSTADRPGALVDVLLVFRDAGINLSHIDKRPSGRMNWQYTFFIDCQGHRRDAAMTAALEEARRHCVSLRVLGSYPAARRVL